MVSSVNKASDAADSDGCSIDARNAVSEFKQVPCNSKYHKSGEVRYSPASLISFGHFGFPAKLIGSRPPHLDNLLAP